MGLLMTAYSLLVLCYTTYLVSCVGPRLRHTQEEKLAKEESHLQNVAILEELRTITDLVLRSQRKVREEEPKSIPIVHDCSTLRDAGIRASGVYSVFPFTFKVYCDMTTDGGGWTVIQRRKAADIHEDFNRTWSDYKLGFGDLYEEFWLGLEPLHQLTHSWPNEMRIDVVDFQHGPKYAHYKIASVGPESDGYRLQVSNYSGSAGDALSRFHTGRRFSTLDRDQDVSRNKSCALEKEGGWWFHACYAAHLNGVYPVNPKRASSSSEIRWWSDRENVLVLTAVEMKIRRRRDRNTTEAAPTLPEVSPEFDDSSVTSDVNLSNEDTQTQNKTEDGFDYDFQWMAREDEVFFADPAAGGSGEEYNITDYSGRSDTNPWWILNLPGFD